MSELHPLAAVPADQRWFWSDRWQRLERKADEDIAAGRVRVYENVDDLLAALTSEPGRSWQRFTRLPRF